MDEERIKCWVSGSEILYIDKITEEDKPDWEDLTDKELLTMFKDLIGKKPEEDPFEVQEDMTYEIYSLEWYMEKFPGFTLEEYQIMVDAAKLENERLGTDRDAF